MPALLAQHAQDLSPWLLVAAAGAVVLVALLLASGLLRRRARRQENRVPSPGSSAPPQLVIERDVRKLMHELSEMTRRATAQLDARAAKLEQLIGEADVRLEKLKGLRPSHNGDGASPAGPPPPPPLPATPTPTPAHVTSTDVTSDDVMDPRYVEIYTLCEEGLSTQQIAERLHRPSGEIELIIALRPRSRPRDHALGSSRD